MIVAYTFGGGRDVFKAGIFFQERSVEKDWLLIRVLQTMTQTFSMKVGHYPWFYTNNQLRWRLTFVQLVARIRCPGDFFWCLQGESLPQFDIPYGKYVRYWDTETLRHWHKIFGLGQWQDIEGKTDSTLACFRLSIYVPPKTDTHGELKSFMIIHGMASTKFFEMDFKHSFAAEIAKVRNAFIGFCSAAVSDTCWIPSPKTTTDSQYPGHSNPRQFICRFP